MITNALIKHDLNKLPTLRDLTTAEQIDHIQNNLEIQPSEETDDLYHLRFRSVNAREAQTVLVTLISVYEKHLEEKYRHVSSDTIDLLRKMKVRFVNELAAQIEEVEQFERKIAAGQDDEDTQARLKELQKEVERIRKKLSTAEAYLKEQPAGGSRTSIHKGFNFETLSPASKGYLVYPRLPVFLLVGGLGGLLIGLIPAGLMIVVFSKRR